MFITRITDRADWFPLWLEDKQSVLDTMIRNLKDDLEDIESYKAQMNEDMKAFRSMSDSQVSHWCFYDMKRRGIIE